MQLKNVGLTIWKIQNGKAIKQLKKQQVPIIYLSIHGIPLGTDKF